LTADKRETHGPIVALSRCGERTPDAARVSCLVDKAIPVLSRRSEPSGKEAARPVARRAHLRVAARNDVRERLVAGDLDHQPIRARAGIWCAARPQDHAI